jgi:2-polyprenyl-3-methyl-5-hydroxy-6-metoxy-1,4-benzoquinol methylase
MRMKVGRHLAQVALFIMPREPRGVWAPVGRNRRCDGLTVKLVIVSTVFEFFFNRTKPDAVLEVGCGSGRIYERLFQEGMTAHYTGVEVAESVIANNRKRFSTAAWHVGTFETLPLRPPYRRRNPNTMF